MPICRQCNTKFPNHVIIDGKSCNLQNRKFCINCSPYGCHNTKQILDDHGKKYCPHCDKHLDIDEFAAKGQRRVSPYCKPCLYHYQMVRWCRRKIEAIKYMGGKCNRCGLTDVHPVLFDFHHCNSTTKEFDWTKMRQMSKNKMHKELAKCELLCVSCHRLQHINPDIWKDVFEHPQ